MFKANLAVGFGLNCVLTIAFLRAALFFHSLAVFGLDFTAFCNFIPKSGL